MAAGRWPLHNEPGVTASWKGPEQWLDLVFHRVGVDGHSSFV